jgi:UDP-N-acetylglucosamine--N-acetylmuramyl-(pentapeptide) pyrophosphoryl-undecaprenol N-acetylglucosamine transferase
VLHEQNAAAGMTNRLLSHLARRVLMGFPGAFGPRELGEVVGNPVRAEVIALAELPLKLPDHQQPLHVLIIGGSLGARVLNEMVPLGLATVDQLQIRHQTGKGNTEQVEMSYRDLGVADVEVSEFIADMAQAYQWADLIICRAGALTVAEVAAAAVPAIFVPLPHAVDDHQTRNAESLTREGAALLLPQRDLTPARLAQKVSKLNSHREQLVYMAQAARRVAILNATERVAAVCRQLTQ